MSKLLEIHNLKKHYTTPRGIVKAVDEINLTIHAGETLGLVGESGCGKSTLGKLIGNLIQPTQGRIEFLDDTIRPQMIFQDPFSSLNPRMTIEQILQEPLLIHKMEAKKAALHLLDLVGLGKTYASRYPHELSGGQKQRIGIARALALKPKLVICDEPVSALDVSIQAQIITLLQDLQKEFNLTYLFIAHDLSVVRYISDRIAVMYLGKIVEIAPSDHLTKHPAHPYTQALISSIPLPDPRVKLKILLDQEIPSTPPQGCPFSTRCPKKLPTCTHQCPSLELLSPNHHVSCHLY